MQAYESSILMPFSVSPTPSSGRSRNSSRMNFKSIDVQRELKLAWNDPTIETDLQNSINNSQSLFPGDLNMLNTSTLKPKTTKASDRWKLARSMVKLLPKPEENGNKLILSYVFLYRNFHEEHI